MGVGQEFAEKFAQAGSNRNALLELMADIDQEKRSVKSALSQLSSEPDERHAKGRQRQEKIRRLKDKMSFLTEEREMVRVKLGQLKMDQKAVKRAQSNRALDFCQAFMAAAERILPEETFKEIEGRAAEIMSSK